MMKSVFPSSPLPTVPGTGPRVDRSVNNYGINTGTMAGGSVNEVRPAARQPAGRDLTSFGVFVNYRRTERHAAMIALLGRELVHQFGEDRVFVDVSSLDPGSRYPDALWLGLQASRVVLAVIHPAWLDELRRRQRQPGKDWVNFEIEAALKAQKVLVPVLLDGAAVPAQHELPAGIRDLAHRTACRLRTADLDRDLAAIIDTVTSHA